MNLPPEKQHLLDTLLTHLAAIPGMQAVVLGGSYARGTARPGSDLDVGLYYAESAPFRIDDVRAAAAAISNAGPPDVTGFYGWGPWVNGGAWVHTAAGKVDFLYRNLDQVQRAIDDAVKRGVTHHDYAQQPAFGFYSVIYLAETRICRPLYDPHGHIARLKEQVAVYPPLLKEKTIASSLWSAEFTLLHADGYAQAGNVYAAVGALARAASYLTQALFALNEVYFMSDKTAMQEIAAFPAAPAGFVPRLNAALAHPGESPAALAQAVEQVRGLWAEVVALAGSYTPAFRL